MKLTTHLKIQLAFLSIIIGVLIYLLFSVNKIRKIDQSIRVLEEREVQLIEALKKFEEEKSKEEQIRLDEIEKLEKLELDEIDKMLNH